MVVREIKITAVTEGISEAKKLISELGAEARTASSGVKELKDKIVDLNTALDSLNKNAKISRDNIARVASIVNKGTRTGRRQPEPEPEPEPEQVEEIVIEEKPTPAKAKRTRTTKAQAPAPAQETKKPARKRTTTKKRVQVEQPEQVVEQVPEQVPEQPQARPRKRYEPAVTVESLVSPTYVPSVNELTRQQSEIYQKLQHKHDAERRKVIKELSSERAKQIRAASKSQLEGFMHLGDISPRKPQKITVSPVDVKDYDKIEKSLLSPGKIKSINKQGIEIAKEALAQVGRPNTRVFAAKMKDEVVGAMAFKIVDNIINKQANLRSIGSKYNDAGIGSALMKEFERIMSSEQVDVAMVENALPEAHMFYQKFGFEPENTQDLNQRVIDMIKKYTAKDFIDFADPFSSIPTKDLQRLLSRTVATGCEQLFVMDRTTGKNVTPTYMSNKSCLRVPAYAIPREWLTTQNKFLAHFHSHPQRKYAFPSVTDIKSYKEFRALDIAGIVSRTGQLLQMKLPENFDEETFTSIYDYLTQLILNKFGDDDESERKIHNLFLSLADAFDIKTHVSQLDTTGTPIEPYVGINLAGKKFHELSDPFRKTRTGKGTSKDTGKDTSTGRKRSVFYSVQPVIDIVKQLARERPELEYTNIYDILASTTMFRGKKTDIKKLWEDRLMDIRQEAIDAREAQKRAEEAARIAKEMSQRPVISKPSSILKEIVNLTLAQEIPDAQHVIDELSKKYNLVSDFNKKLEKFFKTKTYAKERLKAISKLTESMPVGMSGIAAANINPVTGEVIEPETAPKMPDMQMIRQTSLYKFNPEYKPPSLRLRLISPRIMSPEDDERRAEIQKYFESMLGEGFKAKMHMLLDKEEQTLYDVFTVVVKTAYEDVPKTLEHVRNAWQETMIAFDLFDIPNLKSGHRWLEGTRINELTPMDRETARRNLAEKLNRHFLNTRNRSLTSDFYLSRAAQVRMPKSEDELAEEARQTLRKTIEEHFVRAGKKRDTFDYYMNEIKSMRMPEPPRDEYDKAIELVRDIIGKHFVRTGKRRDTLDYLMSEIKEMRMPKSEDELLHEGMQKILEKHFGGVTRGSHETSKPEGSIIDANEILRRVSTRRMPTTKEDTIKETKNAASSVSQLLDAIGSKQAILSRMSWGFTSLAMASLGVYFSLMSIYNVISRAVTSLFNPLSNLQGLIQGYATGQAMLKGTTADLDEYMKRLGIDMNGIVEGSRRYTSILSGINTTIGAFGAKLMLDPAVYDAMLSILSAIQEFFADPRTFDLIKSLIVEFAKQMPEILSAFKFVAEIVRDVILPNIGLLVKIWTVALIAMPVFSLVAGLLKVLDLAQNIGIAFKIAFTSKHVTNFVKIVAGTEGIMAGLGTKLGTIFGMAFQIAAGLAIGLFVVNLLDKYGVLDMIEQQGYKLSHGGSLEGYYQTADKSFLTKHCLGVIKFMAKGGPLREGEPAIVGEAGPELIVPRGGSVEVIPNKDIRKLAEGTTALRVTDRNLFLDLEDKIGDQTRATKDLTAEVSNLVDIMKSSDGVSRIPEGVNVLAPTVPSKNGGPQSMKDLEGVGSWKIIQDNKVYPMKTRVGLGDTLVYDMMPTAPMPTEIAPVALNQTDLPTDNKKEQSGGKGFSIPGAILDAVITAIPTLSLLKAPTMFMKGMGDLMNIASPQQQEREERARREQSQLHKTAYDKLINGQLATKELVDQFKKEQGENSIVSNRHLQGINAKIQSIYGGSNAGTGAGAGTGTGTGGTGGGGPWYGTGTPFPKTTPGSGGAGGNKPEDEKKPTTPGVILPTPSGNIIAPDLTGNPLTDFSETGSGWKYDYKPGKPYGPGGSAGLPSVSYGGINPYSPPGNVNGGWTGPTNTGKYYYTDYTGRTYGPYDSPDISQPAKDGAVTTPPPEPNPNAGPKKSQTEQLVDMGVQFTSAEAQSDHAVVGQYKKEGGKPVFGSIENFAKIKGYAWYGTIEEPDPSTYLLPDRTSPRKKKLQEAAKKEAERQAEITQRVLEENTRRMLEFHGDAPQMATGGLILSDGIIKAHAGEVIGPIERVTSVVAQAANIAQPATTKQTNQTVNINITINGNATKEVTDDMIRKIKRELFGRGM